MSDDPRDEAMFITEDRQHLRLDQVIGSKSEYANLIGRAAASGGTSALSAWARSEMLRGTEVDLMLSALASVLTSTYASVSANVLGDRGEAPAKELLMRQADATFSPAFTAVRDALAKKRAER